MKHTHTPLSPHRDIRALERRRLMAARLFKKRVKHAEIARRLKVSRAAVRQWYVAWKRKGREGLEAAGRLGRKPRLTKAGIARVRNALLRGPTACGYHTDVWTLERIARLIRQTVRVSYHPSHVWKVLAAMGWSCQKPETRARERDERAIQRWREVTWPRIQKRG